VDARRRTAPRTSDSRITSSSSSSSRPTARAEAAAEVAGGRAETTDAVAPAFPRALTTPHHRIADRHVSACEHLPVDSAVSSHTDHPGPSAGSLTTFDAFHTARGPREQ